MKDPRCAEITIGTLRNNENSMLGEESQSFAEGYIFDFGDCQSFFVTSQVLVWDTSQYQAKGDIAKQTLCQPNKDFPD